MLQTSVFLKKTVIHHPTPAPTVLIERVTETRDLNSGHVHARAEPLPPGYVGADDEEKAALVKLEPMPSGHRTALIGRGWRGTQEEHDKRTSMGMTPITGVQKANAAQADALRAAQAKAA